MLRRETSELPTNIRITKKILVLGCLTGLRFSDLLSLRQSDFIERDGTLYLSNTSKKTKTSVLIKLPELFKQYYSTRTKSNQLIFKKISLVNFNKHIKKIAEIAGWIYPVYKNRTIRGQFLSHKGNNIKMGTFRFCDIVSSHIMRRTAITTLLVLGVSELTVRKISGHSSTSSSFMRYVNLAQSYLDNELDTAYLKLQNNL